jgi:hypothetical protein
MMRAIQLAVACVAVLAVSTGQVKAGLMSTGPDAFGYSGSTISSNLRDISSTGVFLPLGDDVFSGLISIGFSFDYYGNTFSQARVSSNGLLDFDLSGSTVQFGPAPDGLSGNANYIGGFMNDLNAPQGNIRYQTLGTPGDREFVVGFYSVPRFFGDPPATFEMILHEGSNNIEFQYGALNDDGSSTWVSMENAIGSDGLTFYNNVGGVTFDNSGYLISTSAVPEPGSLAIFGFGACVAGIGAARRRRREKQEEATA